MFYDTTKNNHNLRYNPFKSCIIPRPIGWISSISENGVTNLAPYSYFNAISDIPPMVMFASGFNSDGLQKDSIRNIESTKEFVVNIVTTELCEHMRLSSSALPHNISEIVEFQIQTEPSFLIKPPRVKASSIHLECRYVKTVDLDIDDYATTTSQMVIGHVVGIHIADKILVNGKIDVEILAPIARLGYDEYAVINKVFRIQKIS